MLFKKKEDRPTPSPEMFYGTFGVWNMDRNSNPYEKRYHIGPNPQQMWFYMMPMMQETWHHAEHKPHRGCHDRKQWKHRMGHHEMNPQKFHEMPHKMHKMQEEQSKENSVSGIPVPHRHGFCRRKFSANSKSEQQQNPSPEFFFEKQSLHSNIY